MFDTQAHQGKRHWLLITALVLTMVWIVTGCGTTGTGPSTTEAGVKPAENKGTAASNQKDSPKERTVKHKLGDVKIPAEPQKIAALVYAHADHLLALGIKPHALVTQTGTEFLPYLKDQLQGVKPLGLAHELNLEAVLAAEPDLIIANTGFHEKTYDSLNKIAPTVLQENYLDAMEWFRDTAKIVGKEKEADVVVKQLLDKAAQAKEKLSKMAGNQTVAFVRVSGKELSVVGIEEQNRGKMTYFGSLLYENVGLKEPDYKAMGIEFKKSIATISMEKLPDLKADHIFMLVRDGADNEKVWSELQQNPIWKTLPAVKNNHLYVVKDSAKWFAGYGPIAFSQIIDEAVTALSK
ncbi:iron-siderophore ABC transporter substrate-binding protein [Paenibacillus sp. FSL H8-0034]|uniref:iron-siderophore ABC transporter substrate-binding protein n=1 Tax=Paenibacillus sp. FSL H8-0034 TaxID=2954671 RepID=UPI0030F59778